MIFFTIIYCFFAIQTGGSGPYIFQDDQNNILPELQNPTLAEIAKYQEELNYPMELDQPGKHVLAVVFFTPEGANGDGMQLDVVTETGGMYLIYVFYSAYLHSYIIGQHLRNSKNEFLICYPIIRYISFHITHLLDTSIKIHPYLVMQTIVRVSPPAY